MHDLCPFGVQVLLVPRALDRPALQDGDQSSTRTRSKPTRSGT